MAKELTVCPYFHRNEAGKQAPMSQDALYENTENRGAEISEHYTAEVQ